MPSDEPNTAKRSTFLQDTAEGGTPIQIRLGTVALLIGVGAAIYAEAWEAGALAAVAAYVILTIGYAILARLFGWRRLRCMAFFGDLIEFLSW